ncbi:MAG: biopolymer transporter ExbD, partial [Myxococcales bacterium]|nr:biopolymer transporter ExbD [Myxococcales bacterium]
DLLLCCVMFLLATAVWSQVARINANQKVPSSEAPDTPPPEEKVKVILQIQNSGFVLASTAGDRIEIPKNGEAYDIDGLRRKLQERKQLDPNRKDLIVAPEDGVRYDEIVSAMDVVVGEGYPDMSLSDGAGL